MCYNSVGCFICLQSREEIVTFYQFDLYLRKPKSGSPADIKLRWATGVTHEGLAGHSIVCHWTNIKLIIFLFFFYQTMYFETSFWVNLNSYQLKTTHSDTSDFLSGTVLSGTVLFRHGSADSELKTIHPTLAGYTFNSVFKWIIRFF